MSTPNFIAKRYLKSGSQNRFFSWISFLTISGVAIGVAAMIVVWSLINGFEIELRKRFLEANAHIMAYRFPHGLPNYEQWAKDVAKDFKDEVKGVSPFIHYETMVRKDSIMHAMLVRGVHPSSRENVQSLSPIVTPKTALDIIENEIKDQKLGKVSSGTPSIIIGSGLASMLEAKTGDLIELVEPDKQDFKEMKKFKVIGIYDSGLKHYDNKIGIMSIPTAQRFFKMGSRVIGLEIGLHTPRKSKEIAREMSERYSLSIREWQTFNRPLFEAMEKERIVILIITALVAAVAALNILTTIFVAVSQKQKDISILKALGASNRFILSIFIRQGVYISSIGCAAGVILAYSISNILERYQFIDLPDLYLLAKIPMTYDWRVYLTVCVASGFVALLAAFLPAKIASRVNPVEGFRGNQGVGVK